MSSERYSPEKHLPTIAKWGVDRQMMTSDAEIDPTLYPPTGFVVNGVLASWVYFTNSALAYIDSTIADPNSTKEQRWEAMQEMLPLLLEEASSRDAKVICTLAFHKSFDKLLSDDQFTKLPDTYTVYLKRL